MKFQTIGSAGYPYPSSIALDIGRHRSVGVDLRTHEDKRCFVGRFHNPGRVENLIPFIFIRMESLHNIKSCPACPPQTLQSLCLRQAWFWAFRCFFHRLYHTKCTTCHVLVATTTRDQSKCTVLQRQHHKEAKRKIIHVEYYSQTNISHAHT